MKSTSPGWEAKYLLYTSKIFWTICHAMSDVEAEVKPELFTKRSTFWERSTDLGGRLEHFRLL